VLGQFLALGLRESLIQPSRVLARLLAVWLLIYVRKAEVLTQLLAPGRKIEV
jgi:hypothetical protein